ncbi:MAG TPA: hypothetical protein VHI98_07420 [Vicinamibacterales bacterium]|jgi:hypothetical protein|nr:hypothetical protein [Vicinamibacterales bacterium]
MLTIPAIVQYTGSITWLGVTNVCAQVAIAAYLVVAARRVYGGGWPENLAKALGRCCAVPFDLEHHKLVGGPLGVEIRLRRSHDRRQANPHLPHSVHAQYQTTITPFPPLRNRSSPQTLFPSYCGTLKHLMMDSHRSLRGYREAVTGIYPMASPIKGAVEVSPKRANVMR